MVYGYIIYNIQKHNGKAKMVIIKQYNNDIMENGQLVKSYNNNLMVILIAI